ncbi:MAG: hypothetical protein KKB20_00280 [Proteobacteria bacterium]|nr:hypothetical protein [Pseudomonadota bacterium]
MNVGSIGSQTTGMSGTYGTRQGAPPPPPDQEDWEKKLEEITANIIAERDQDGDGALTLEEAGIDAEQFAKDDADGDGLVTLEELRTAFKNRHESMNPADMQASESNSALTNPSGLGTYQSAIQEQLLALLEQSDSESEEDQSMFNFRPDKQVNLFA